LGWFGDLQDVPVRIPSPFFYPHVFGALETLAPAFSELGQNKEPADVYLAKLSAKIQRIKARVVVSSVPPPSPLPLLPSTTTMVLPDSTPLRRRRRRPTDRQDKKPEKRKRKIDFDAMSRHANAEAAVPSLLDTFPSTSTGHQRQLAAATAVDASSFLLAAASGAQQLQRLSGDDDADANSHAARLEGGDEILSVSDDGTDPRQPRRSDHDRIVAQDEVMTRELVWPSEISQIFMESVNIPPESIFD